MHMDGLPGELSSYPRSDSPSGYHFSSGESEMLVGFGPAIGRCAWRSHRICLSVGISSWKDISSSSRNQPLSDRVICWYFSRCVLVGSSSSASLDFCRWCISAYLAVASDQLLMLQPCPVVIVVLFLPDFEGERQYRTLISLLIWRASGNTALSSPCWYLLATMRRVVNYHSSWFGQQQVELLMHLVFPVWCKDERQQVHWLKLLGIRIRPPVRQRKNKYLEYREAINTKNSSTCINIHRVFQACYLAGTCAWLQPVFQEPGASRLIAVDTPIRSTTRSETPSSDCTRSPDEISTIGFTSKN
ncbi:hypothetical protein F511_40070 [Dorcoceras hygrometricum]|uniref:Uncharacterized protein n=1 Tax=Dorcoceras hygrometricum TaxID=472368 RepID=A0A2Z7CES2_9LAMI|nr:hypothetical protein F511_40070 [Dorcoceras hygrometricum]